MVKMYSSPNTLPMVSSFKANFKHIIYINLIYVRCNQWACGTYQYCTLLSEHEVLSQNVMGFFYFLWRACLVCNMKKFIVQKQKCDTTLSFVTLTYHFRIRLIAGTLEQKYLMISIGINLSFVLKFLYSNRVFFSFFSYFLFFFFLLSREKFTA